MLSEPCALWKFSRFFWIYYSGLYKSPPEVHYEEVLAILPYSREKAKSIKEIAQAMGSVISSYVDWVRAERRLVRALGALIRWGWVAYDNRQKEEGHKFWYNAYWKTELAKV